MKAANGKKVNSMIQILFLAVTGLILFLVIFVDKTIDYSMFCTLDVKLSNIVLACLGLAALIGAGIITCNISQCQRVQKLVNKYFYGLLWSGFFIGLCIQVLIAYHIYFYAGWDVSIVVGTADELTAGIGGIGDFYYYSQYTNNIGIVAILALIQKVVTGIGFLPTQCYLFCVIAGCVMISFSGLLTALVVRRMTGSAWWALFSGALFFLIGGMSPWMAVPYTDAYSCLFPVLTFYLYLCAKKRAENRGGGTARFGFCWDLWEDAVI